jgi:hypothetical protein
MSVFLSAPVLFGTFADDVLRTAFRETGEECQMCYEKLVDAQVNRERGDFYMLPNCRHIFHLGCLHSWSQTRRACPKCRTTFGPLPALPVPTPPAPPAPPVQTNEQPAPPGQAQTEPGWIYLETMFLHEEFDEDFDEFERYILNKVLTYGDFERFDVPRHVRMRLNLTREPNESWGHLKDRLTTYFQISGFRLFDDLEYIEDTDFDFGLDSGDGGRTQPMVAQLNLPVPTDSTVIITPRDTFMAIGGSASRQAHRVSQKLLNSPRENQTEAIVVD